MCSVKKWVIAFLVSAMSVLSSCDDSLEGGIGLCDVLVAVELPEDVSPESVSDVSIVFHNVSSLADTQFFNNETMRVIPGLYDVTYTATARLVNGAESELRAVRTSVVIGGDRTVISMQPFNNIANDDFIIAEIFFAGTLQPSGNQYNGDDYVKIYNNTDHVLYADGLTFFESRFLTTEKYDYSPDIMSEAVTVHALYTIPGSGHEHPVEPGGYILLADTGIDHRVINPNSFDLSHADWEWYDVSTQPNELDIDSPSVPNLDKIYCYTKSFFILHNRGFKCYGLSRIQVDNATYNREYKYT